MHWCSSGWLMHFICHRGGMCCSAPSSCECSDSWARGTSKGFQHSHLLLQSCSCFSKNRSSKTDSGVPSQLLQFITTVVTKADINGNFHISEFPFTYVATNAVTCTTPWEQEPPSAAELLIWMVKTMSCGTWVPLRFKQCSGSGIK